MPPRRKSVAFNLAEEAAPAASEPSRGARSSRSSRAAPEEAPPPPPPPPPVEEPPSSRTTRSRKTSLAEVEVDKGFKFKRRKTAKEPEPAAEAMDVEPPPPPPPKAAPAASKAAEKAAKPAERPVAAASTKAAGKKAATAAPPPPPPAAAPRPPSFIKVTAATEPPPPPSALADASPELLHALFEVCNAATMAASNASSAASSTLLPAAERTAAVACLAELKKLGVTSAPNPNPEAAKLDAREAELAQRVSELEETLSQWEAASKEPPPPLTITAEGAAAAATADTTLLAKLPEVPPVEEQLAELGFLAGMCAEQMAAAAKQVLATVAQAEGERQRLAKAAHQASFKGYLDVNEPKALLRGLLA